jgi:hypothetical protein
MTKFILSILLLFSFSFSAIASLNLEQESLSSEMIDKVGIKHASELFYDDLMFKYNPDFAQALTRIEVSHGWANVGIGSGMAYVQTSPNHLIEHLYIDVTVGLLGINKRIKQSITIHQLLSGSPLKFYMDTSAKKAALLINPSSSFTKIGGKAQIKILNRSGTYDSVSINISKDLTGRYSIMKNKKEVKGLSIHVRGLNLSTMYIGDYKLH